MISLSIIFIKNVKTIYHVEFTEIIYINNKIIFSFFFIHELNKQIPCKIYIQVLNSFQNNSSRLYCLFRKNTFS